MWPDCLHHSLPHYLIRDTTFRAKKMQWTWNLFWFSLQLLSETFFYSKKNFARQYHTRTRIFIWNTHYSLQTLMKPDFSRQVFEKYSGIKFHENPSSGSRDVRYGHTHTHTHTHTQTWRRYQSPVAILRMRLKTDHLSVLFSAHTYVTIPFWKTGHLSVVFSTHRCGNVIMKIIIYSLYSLCA